jgi:ubiquitin carboxyl-terminal hydrolase 22/27/51
MHSPEHIQNLLKNAGDKAAENYARMMRAIREESNVSANVYKNGEGARATGDISYLCFQCPNVSKKKQAHRKDHIFCE